MYYSRIKRCKCCNISTIVNQETGGYCENCDRKFREFIVLYTRLIESLLNYYFPNKQFPTNNN